MIAGGIAKYSTWALPTLSPVIIRKFVTVSHNSLSIYRTSISYSAVYLSQSGFTCPSPAIPKSSVPKKVKDANCGGSMRQRRSSFHLVAERPQLFLDIFFASSNFFHPNWLSTVANRVCGVAYRCTSCREKNVKLRVQYGDVLDTAVGVVEMVENSVEMAR